jgi:hypothetical protein
VPGTIPAIDGEIPGGAETPAAFRRDMVARKNGVIPDAGQLPESSTSFRAARPPESPTSFRTRHSRDPESALAPGSIERQSRFRVHFPDEAGKAPRNDKGKVDSTLKCNGVAENAASFR